jgi:hypothetical protein
MRPPARKDSGNIKPSSNAPIRLPEPSSSSIRQVDFSIRTTTEPVTNGPDAHFNIQPAIARPISSGEFFGTKWILATVFSVSAGHADEVDQGINGEERTRLDRQEQLGHITRPQPVRTFSRDRMHIGGLARDGYLPWPC